MSNRTFNENLIDEIQACPAIYNTSFPSYNDVAFKNQCWDQIAVNLGTDVNVCRRKWKNLRDTLLWSIKNTKSNMKWQYYQRMKFILPFTKHETLPDEEINGPDSHQSHIFTAPLVYKMDRQNSTDEEVENDIDNDNSEPPLKRKRSSENHQTVFESKSPVHSFFASLATQVQHFSKSQSLRLQSKCLQYAVEIQKENE